MEKEIKTSNCEAKFKPVTLTLESIDEVVLFTSLLGALSLSVTNKIVANGTTTSEKVFIDVCKCFNELSSVAEAHDKSHTECDIVPQKIN